MVARRDGRPPARFFEAYGFLSQQFPERRPCRQQAADVQTAGRHSPGCTIRKAGAVCSDGGLWGMPQ